ncbi:hypothetical protein [Zavarzinella formosa]|uniref:hypothetical protein n=1 Tax=Zavarzinella formosa TaxID=360055 RepID=UPI00031F8347|nr:hypothetical protein [Zavarzinella formosa]
MTQHFTTDQLDADTLRYLQIVAAADGKRMPGIYNGQTNLWPVGGLIIGIAILVATFFLTFPPTEEPTKEACLQTAGALLGGWMITAAFRVWMASASGKRLGDFVYADSLSLYEVSGNSVTVTSLTDIEEAKVTQNFSEGAYQNSAVSVKLVSGRKFFTLYSELTGKRMAIYLNSLAYMRAGGEDGTDEQLKALNPTEMAAVAKHISSTGNFPRTLADVDEVDHIEVPVPRSGGSGMSGGFIWYLMIIGVGAVMFFGFQTFNKLMREDTIYDRIMQLSPKDQPPALRLYLARPEFNKHRAEAEAKLLTAYTNASTRMIQGKNPDFQESMRILVMSLATRPQPVISLVIEEENAAGDPQAKDRMKKTRDQLADKWGSTIGDELVIFAEPDDPAVKGMIQIAYRFQNGGLAYSVTFRKGPDDEPFKKLDGVYKATLDPNAFDIPGFVDHLLGESCGITVQRVQIPLDEDF